MLRMLYAQVWAEQAGRHLRQAGGRGDQVQTRAARRENGPEKDQPAWDATHEMPEQKLGLKPGLVLERGPEREPGQEREPGPELEQGPKFPARALRLTMNP